MVPKKKSVPAASGSSLQSSIYKMTPPEGEAPARKKMGTAKRKKAWNHSVSVMLFLMVTARQQMVLDCKISKHQKFRSQPA